MASLDAYCWTLLRLQSGKGGIFTFSKSIAFIAESMPFTTFAILPVTWRIVTAVCTLLLTASRREASRNRLRRSFCLRMAFCAYILAMSEWFCWMAWRGERWGVSWLFVVVVAVIMEDQLGLDGGRSWWIQRHTFFTFDRSVSSSFFALAACRLSCLAVN